MRHPHRGLLDVRTIYHEPAVLRTERGAQIIARFPGARLVETKSHWAIPELHGNAGSVSDWLRIKRETLVLGIKKDLKMRPNGRSADFIAPSTSNGCAMACAYCYVPRRKGYANPITAFVNIEANIASIRAHAERMGAKTEANQVDPARWVYDLGENGDLSIDAYVSDNVRDLIAAFRSMPNAKASFATKHVNRGLLDYDPQGATRVRMSLMPPDVARVVDVRTTPMRRRIAFMNDLHRAGYEVQANLSPVIVRPGWTEEWRLLLERLGDELDPEVRDGMGVEVIMLTHNQALHEVNMGWHPRAEELLWTPALQEGKTSQNGQDNVRYASGKKRVMLDRLLSIVSSTAPWMRVRYAF
jgi:spore photoproduct lyase family protein